MLPDILLTRAGILYGEARSKYEYIVSDLYFDDSNSFHYFVRSGAKLELVEDSL